MATLRGPIELPRPLVAPEAFLVTLVVGIVPETDHAQLGWEVEDPIAEQLLGMGSTPHVSLAKIHQLSSHTLREVLDAVFADLEPF